MANIEKDFIHMVLFWLKNPNSTEDRQKFEASIKNFTANSKYLKTAHVGTPIKATREVVDDSYTYSLLVTFDSEAEHDKYQVEPAHIAFIDECKELWSRVQIFDSEAI